MKSAKFLILNFQGSAATYLRCGGQPNTKFVGNLLVFAVVKEFLQIDQELTKLWPWLGWHPFFDSRCSSEKAYLPLGQVPNAMS